MVSKGIGKGARARRLLLLEDERSLLVRLLDHPPAWATPGWYEWQAERLAEVEREMKWLAAGRIGLS